MAALAAESILRTTTISTGMAERRLLSRRRIKVRSGRRETAATMVRVILLWLVVCLDATQLSEGVAGWGDNASEDDFEATETDEQMFDTGTASQRKRRKSR